MTGLLSQNFYVKVKPISINKAFQGRRFKTSECKEFEEELSYLLPKARLIKGEVEIRLTFFLKNYKRTDISNLVKILEDILVKKGFIEDDRKVKRMTLEKIQYKEDYIKIEISQANKVLMHSNVSLPLAQIFG